jgi:hypothetical protein
LPKLILPWGEQLNVEDMERFSLDVMSFTGEYYVDLPTCQLLVVTSDDFKLDPDSQTITVKSCKVRFIEVWPEEDVDDLEQKWQDFMFVESRPIPRDKE